MFRVVGGLEDVQGESKISSTVSLVSQISSDAYSDAVTRDLKSDEDEPTLSSSYQPLSRKLDELQRCQERRSQQVE